MARVTLNIHDSRLRTYVEMTGDRVSRHAANNMVEKVRTSIQREGLVETGRMLRSVRARKSGDSRYRVWPAVPYARYQEHGTGGSTARPGSMLVFKPKGSGSIVFAKRTRPIPASRFMAKAMRRMTVADFVPPRR